MGDKKKKGEIVVFTCRKLSGAQKQTFKKKEKK